MLDEKLTANWIAQVSEALSYLHNSLFIAHRDIKLENILLNDQNEAKLSDFGFAVKAYDEETETIELSKTFCGSKPYQCPQIIKRVKYDPYKADAWAMGVLIFGMLNDRLPFHTNDKNQFFNEQKDPKYLGTRYKKEFCEHIKQLIAGLLTVDESKRFEINDILKSDWIKKKGNCCQ
ncbi:unnamed protein product [Medioppia subpectinata]|uniref:Protein kinase domain-containing protein n=1 Tax=Medioppia subpectinata TaxID=1979941 RepID=A0A7R9L1X0_9ACAR|nr:unnamed protein product [Medioppia subpectinata]CAG2113980.1 unnamed protein product [Medioppia subpectinata]